MLLGDAGIHIMRARAFTEITGDAVRTRRGGGNDHQPRFLRETRFQGGHGHLAIVFARVERLAQRAVRILPMVRLALAGMGLRIRLIATVRAVRRCGSIVEAQSLGGVDVQHDGMVDVLQRFKRVDECIHVVALLHIPVVQTESLEQVQLRGAARSAQPCEIAVHAAEILGDRHFVVVDDDDEISALLGRVVQSFEGDRRAQRTVADDGDHIADGARPRRRPLHIAGLGETAGKGYGCAGMPQHEGIMLAFLGIGETGHLTETRFVQVRFGTAGKHFVHIALMGDIEDETVVRRIEYAMQRHGELHHAKIGTDMAAVLSAIFQQCGANLSAQVT